MSRITDSNIKAIKAADAAIKGSTVDIVGFYWEMGDALASHKASFDVAPSLRDVEDSSGVSKSRLSRAQSVRSSFKTADAARKGYVKAGDVGLAAFVAGLNGSSVEHVAATFEDRIGKLAAGLSVVELDAAIKLFQGARKAAVKAAAAV